MKCQSLLPTTRSYSNGDRINISINIILAIVSLTVNGTLFHSIIKLKMSQRTTFRFCLYMCVSDFLISLILQPLISYVSALSENICTAYDVLIQCMAHGFYQFSGFMMTLVAIERYYQLGNRQNTDEHFNKRTANRLIILALVLCLFLVLCSGLSSFYMFLFELQAVLTAINLSIFIAVMILYIKGIRLLRNAVAPTNNNLLVNRVSRKIVTLVVILVLCYIPMFIVYPLYLYRKYKLSKDIDPYMTIAMSFTVPLPVVNGILQPALIIIASKDLRSHVKARIGRLFSCVLRINVHETV